MKRISAKEAKALLDAGWTYLDVRSEPEFESGHPAGALNIPLLHLGASGMGPNPDFVKVVEATVPKNAKLVIGCQSGGRSMRAAQLLERAGYREVVDQRAGFGGARDMSGQVVEPGWADEGLPVETGLPEGRRYVDLAKKAG
ncbi:MAG: rhodanese-like domain-containing protein [Myxococcota bacterium]